MPSVKNGSGTLEGKMKQSTIDKMMIESLADFQKRLHFNISLLVTHIHGSGLLLKDMDKLQEELDELLKQSNKEYGGSQ